MLPENKKEFTKYLRELADKIDNEEINIIEFRGQFYPPKKLSWLELKMHHEKYNNQEEAEK